MYDCENRKFREFYENPKASSAFASAAELTPSRILPKNLDNSYRIIHID